jgi:AbrB family looped-hinge helix DNA binding protein
MLDLRRDEGYAGFEIIKFRFFRKVYTIRKLTCLIVPKKNDKDAGCAICASPSGCRVEAVLSVDERGQMVLPKEVREKAGIQTGEKLALISCERDGKVCCLALIKAGELSGMVKGLLGPLFGEKE